MPLQHQEAGPKTVSSAPISGSPVAPLTNAPLPSLHRLDRLTPQQVLHLQRAVGNRQVAQLLGRNSPSASGGLTVSGTVTVNAPNDRHEQEAERVSRQVVSGGPVGPITRGNTPGVQRLAIEVEEFREHTNKGMLRQRGDILTSIDTLLKAYQSLPAVVEDNAERQKRKDHIAKMKYIAQRWIERHDVRKMDSVSDGKKRKHQGKPKKRADTLADIVVYLETVFIPLLDAEDQHLNNVRTAETMNQILPPVQDDKNKEQRKEQRKRANKYMRKYAQQEPKLKKKFSVVKTDTGKFFGSILPAMMRLLAPGPGDIGKFDFQLDFSLEGATIPWFVGGRINLEAEAKESNEFKAKFKGAFRTGPKFAAVKLALELGVQLEAQAQSPEEVSKLFDYGLYRRFRESDVIPRGVTNALWGGNKGTFGYMNAEMWAAGVEQDVFNTDKNKEKAYVDLGGYGALRGNAKFGFGKLEGEGFMYRGRKYTKHTLDTTKGVGTTQYVKHGAQKKAGQGSRRYELGAKVQVKPFEGDLKLKYESVAATDTQTNRNKGQVGQYRPHKYELEINAGVMLPPTSNLAERIAISAGPAVGKMIRDIAVMVQTKEKGGEKAQRGFSMFAGQLGEAAVIFENQIEVNQKTGSGFLSELGNVSSTTGERSVSSAAEAAKFSSGYNLRIKITKEYALNRDQKGSFKIEGGIYTVNKMGFDISSGIVDTKLSVNRGTRIAQIKWEKDKKLRFEFFGIAGMAEKKKDDPNDPNEQPTWHRPTYQPVKGPTKPAVRNRPIVPPMPN